MTNALAQEKSPYLRAHANNPVDWQPWGDDALARARREGRPLFVSVGYSACHWCHVMAREAFSDTGVADFLNAHFVSIKVDREERPDIDQVLQVAHQALNGRGGGWPLSVFLEPESLTPFFAGTYFPLVPRYGMPGFAMLLERIIEVWHEQRTDLVAQGRRLQQHLIDQLGSDPDGAGAVPGSASIEMLCQHLETAFDAVHGGFGDGPKFPQCPALAFLMAHDGGSILQRTLAAMAGGGLRDHVGGGFFRYTVDTAWRVPHFEKMLSDNAQLLALYAEAAVCFSSEAWREVALETASFMDAELALPDGGCATSLNAESGGEEGDFYLWDRAQVEQILEHYPPFAAAYGLEHEPLVEGRWHLARVDGGRGGFDAELERLKQTRASRTRPERDDKRLTSLNALLVTALARASLLLDAPELGARAVAIFATLESDAIKGDQVLACALGDESYQPGFLADYAFLAEAALAVAALGDGEAAVALARQLADAMLARFRTAAGGLAVTDAAADTLLYRPRAYADDALPSAAGAAARVWMALGHLLAQPDYLDAAEVLLRAAGGDMQRSPDAHPTLLAALAEWWNPPPQVVLRSDASLRAWAVAAQRIDPQSRVFQLGANVSMPELVRYAARDSALAYVCRGTVCSAPVTNVEALSDLLTRPSHDNETS